MLKCMYVYRRMITQGTIFAKEPRLVPNKQNLSVFSVVGKLQAFRRYCTPLEVDMNGVHGLMALPN